MREKLIAAAIFICAVKIIACHVRNNSADFIPNGKFAANAGQDARVDERRNAPRRKMFAALLQKPVRYPVGQDYMRVHATGASLFVRGLSRINFSVAGRNIVFLLHLRRGGSVQKILDKFFTGVVLCGLVSSAYLSYYLPPWRRLRSSPANPEIQDDPFAQIPLPQSVDNRNSEKSERAEV